MVDIQTLSIAMASVSVVIGIVYYSFQIRNQTKARQTDLIMRMYSTFGSKEYLEASGRLNEMEFEDFKDFEKKYGPIHGTAPENVSISMVGMLFEAIGYLVHRKLVNINTVSELFPIAPIIWSYRVKPIAEGAREKFNLPGYFKWFEYLNNEMQKREQRLQIQQ